MSDLIDRQATLEALLEKGQHSRRYKLGDIWELNYDEIREVINALPAADPHWIPCGERLPEHGGRYLISVLDGINRRTTVAPYLPRCKAWTMSGRMAYWKVIAWMPLPEPYKEDDK